jgi:hypothetical protein
VCFCSSQPSYLHYPVPYTLKSGNWSRPKGKAAEKVRFSFGHDYPFKRVKKYKGMKRTVVAIFEDDLVNRFIYERLLHHRKEDIELYIFDNPYTGIEMAKKIPFDIVFIEAHFWEAFGGISILQKLKDIPLLSMVAVAMTSLLQKGDLEHLTSSGFMYCLERRGAFTEADFARFF